MYDLKLSDMTLTTWTLLRQTWSVMDKAAEMRLAKVKLTPEKVAVLWICRDYPGLLTTAEIARFLSRQSQSVTGLLNRMEEEGLVTRAPKRKGRPFTEVKLTEKGEKACSVGVAVVKALVAETAPVLTRDERQRLHGYLEALRRQMVEGMHLELNEPPGFARQGYYPGQVVALCAPSSFLRRHCPVELQGAWGSRLDIIGGMVSLPALL